MLRAWEELTRRRLLVVGLDGTVLWGGRRVRSLLARFLPNCGETALQTLIDRAVAAALRESDGDSLVWLPAPGPFSCQSGLFRGESGEPLAVLIEVDQERASSVPMDRLLHMLSHEIRTPLSILHGFAELLLTREFSDSEKRSHIGIIAQESIRLAAILNDFIDLERLEAGVGVLNLEEADLNSLVRGTVEASGGAPRVSLRTPPGSLRLQADSGRLVRALEILVESALTLTPAPEPVEFEVSLAPGRAICTCHGRGARIPEEALHLLFSKAYRPSQSDWPRFHGFSMALLERIVSAHSGTVEVENSPSGVIFSLSLPHCGTPSV